MTPQTNPTVAKHATERSTFNRNKQSLIGIFGTTENRRVLVRHATGKVETLALGDTLSPGKITAISDDSVMISSALGNRKLTLPNLASTRSAA